MASLSLTNCCFLPGLTGPKSSLDPRLRCENFPFPVLSRCLLSHRSGRRCSALSPSESLITDSMPSESGTYKVGDFMTKKQDLHVVKPTTTVDEALEALVEKRITGFPVIDDDWNLVGVVSDYDLLALDSISGGSQNDVNMFPDVNSTWKLFCQKTLAIKYAGTASTILLLNNDYMWQTFNKIQKLLSKTNGKVVGDLMTSAPLVVHETSNLEDAARSESLPGEMLSELPCR